MSLLTKKISNPLNFYKNPHQVEEDSDLSIENKIKVLTNWLNDIELRETAENENMRDNQKLPHNSSNVLVIERLLKKYKHLVGEQD